MESLFDHPFTLEGNRVIYKWIKQAKDDGVLDDQGINPPRVLMIINHAEQCDLLGDMSREEAVVFLSLWIGRANGAMRG